MASNTRTSGSIFPRGFSTHTRFPWPLVRADELVVLNYGKALRDAERRPGNVRVYGTNGQCGWHDTPLREGPGVILGRKGQGPLGVEWCHGKYWVIDTAYFVTPKTDNLNLKYFYYLVKYIGLNHLKDGTSNPSLSRDTFNALLLPFPPTSVQKAIAHILGTLDDKIELNRRMNETLEAMARAIFKSWFVDFDPVRAKAEGRNPGLPKPIADLFPDSFEDSELGEIPRRWEVRSLPEVFEINPTRSLSKGVLAPYLDMGNMPTQGPSPESWVMREMGSGMKFVNGDTLVARITPCLENGKTAFVDFLTDGEVGWGSTEYIVLRPTGAIPPIFAYLLARTDDFRTFAIQQMTGSSGRQRVPADSLDKYRIPTPEIHSPIFQHFGELVSPMFGRIKAAMGQSRTLAALRDALLPKLLSGELRLPGAERIAGRYA